MKDALASYVRTIMAGDSPVDLDQSGRPDTISEEVRGGMRVFRVVAAVRRLSALCATAAAVLEMPRG